MSMHSFCERTLKFNAYPIGTRVLLDPSLGIDRACWPDIYVDGAANDDSDDDGEAK